MSNEKKILIQILSNEVIPKILSKEYDNVKIKSIESTSGSTAGDNNLSEISRISVKFQNDNTEMMRSFIIKDTVKEDTSIFVNLVKGIEKENSFYLNIAPEFENLGVNISPKCHIKLDDLLILEDLSLTGYRVLDRKKMLGLDHCKSAVKSLAKFHAVTHYLYVNNKLPDISIKNTIFIPENKNMIYLNYKYFDCIIKSLNDMNIYKYNDKINQLKNTAFEKLIDCFNKDTFKCIQHGDFWTANMLFNDNDYNDIDTKIIDYQLTILGVPSYDLHFFICTSMKPEIRNNENNLTEIIDYYLESLNSTLKKIGLKEKIENKSFYKIMKETEFIGLYTALCFLTIPMCEKPIDFNLPEHLSEEEKVNYIPWEIVYKQETYRKLLVSLLEYYEKNGVL